MEPESVAVLFGEEVMLRNRDTEHRFRQDSNVWYLTGLEEPQVVCLFVRPAEGDGELILFVEPRDATKECWTGPMVGLEGATAVYGADVAASIAELTPILAERMGNMATLYYRLGDHEARDRLVLDALRRVRGMARQNISAPTTIIDPTPILHEMRLIKDTDEIACLRRACALSADGHREAMRVAQVGMFEYEVEGFLEGYYRRGGARRNAFEPIVAAGPNATVLHYTKNDRRIAAGDLLLIDAGAEVDYYCGDITRTFPVGGRFSDEQRAIYQLVLDAQKAAIAVVRPGLPWDGVHQAALEVLVDGLIALGLLGGTREEALESGSYKAYYMHKTGHWLGLDVHDVGEYGKPGAWRELEPGMVLTVEPGLYIAPGSEADERYHGIGVRIEDNLLVTEDGGEVLTGGVPKEIDEIEAWVLGAPLS
ncbi:MAG: aminopeptidase P N-terminal domain-containing protein [Myxococcales bacterium]|nr:aminopeptidase P N-terminal domain-containing protein [Myxococcales bacterium]